MSESKETATRQDTIFYRRGGNPWGQLEPHVHEGLYKRPEVAFGVAFMAANPFVEGLCVRLGDDLFMLTALVEGNPNEKAFNFQTQAASNLVLPEGL